MPSSSRDSCSRSSCWGDDATEEDEEDESEDMQPRSEVLPRAPSQVPEGTLWTGDRVIRERVLVRVYDLGTTFISRWHNEVTTNFGAFHTGVEVYGREWSFGMTPDDSSGVVGHAPCKNSDHAFRETLCMGYTNLSDRQVRVLIEKLRWEWRGSTYNVLSRNCHNFTDTLCQKLGVARLPSWVNTLASTGAQSVQYLGAADGGYDGGKALVDYWGSMKDSLYAMFIAPPPARPHETHLTAEEEARRQAQVARAGYPPGHHGGHPAFPSAVNCDDPRLRQHNPFSVLRRR